MASTSTKHKKSVRQVHCTYCGKDCDVAQRAMSVFCPHCHKRLILEDYKIKSYYAVREFYTCGNIVVEKKGHVVAPVRAGTLTVLGKVQGSVTTQGTVNIAKSGSFKGDIEAPTLHIESGAVIEGFLRIGEPNGEVVVDKSTKKKTTAKKKTVKKK